MHAITAAARRASQENPGERIALAGPDDELEELADAFDAMLARLDAATAAVSPWTIVQSVAAAHQGRVTAERLPAGGLTVRVELPCR